MEVEDKNEKMVNYSTCLVRNLKVPIPWLSAKVIQFKETLDREREKILNSQSKRQTKRKITGETSERIRPHENRWIFKKENNTKTMHDCVYM